MAKQWKVLSQSNSVINYGLGKDRVELTLTAFREVTGIRVNGVPIDIELANSVNEAFQLYLKIGNPSHKPIL